MEEQGCSKIFSICQIRTSSVISHVLLSGLAAVSTEGNFSGFVPWGIRRWLQTQQGTLTKGYQYFKYQLKLSHWRRKQYGKKRKVSIVNIQFDYSLYCWSNRNPACFSNGWYNLEAGISRSYSISDNGRMGLSFNSWHLLQGAKRSSCKIRP